MTINERLKKLRGESDLTQAELAKALNIGQSTVAAYESTHDPNIYSLISYAKYFCCSLDFLAGIEEENFVPPVLVGEQERELLLEFRKLKPEAKEFLLKMAHSLSEAKLNL